MRAIRLMLLLALAAAYPSFASPTMTRVTVTPASVAMGGITTATATVSAEIGAATAPSGLVFWSDDNRGGTFNSPCTLSAVSVSESSCSIGYGPDRTFPAVPLRATYAGDGFHSGSVGVVGIFVTKRSTATSVSPTPGQVSKADVIVLTGTVTDTSPAPVCCFAQEVNPISAVSWSANPPLLGSFSSPSCSTSPVAGSLTASSCSITYTATAAGQVAFTAGFFASETHSSSSGATAWAFLVVPTTTTIALSAPSVVIGGTATATVTVTDTSAIPAPPTGTVSWSNGLMGGTFAPATCTLSAVSASKSSCSVSFGPGAPFVLVQMTAAYSGGPFHGPSSGLAVLAITKRSTVTSVSPASVQITKGDVVVFTATVADTSPAPACCIPQQVNPATGVVWSADPALRGTFSSGSCSLSPVASSSTASSCSVTYTASTFGSVTINAGFGGDAIHGTSAVAVVSGGNPPVAAAGPDQTASPGMVVVLDGTASFDKDADPLTYSWTQTAGPAVALTGANTPTPSFTVPATISQATLAFTLTVNDGTASATDAVSVVDTPSTIFSFEPVLALNDVDIQGRQPTLAVSGNNVYAVWLHNCPACATNGTVSFIRSTNAGATFGPIVTLSPPAAMCNGAVACSPTWTPIVASAGNHVYVAWVDIGHGTFLAASSDGGVTFSPAVKVVAMAQNSGTLVQLVASREFVHLLSHCGNCAPGSTSGQMFLSTSADFGRTFSTRVLSSLVDGSWAQIALSQDNVYVVWREHSAIAGIEAIKFIRSSDNGATLKAPLTLNDPANSSNNPQIAVSGSRVHVAWRDAATEDVMLRSSSDAGATFATASAPLPGTTGVISIPGLAADGSGVYALSAHQGLDSALEFRASGNFGAMFAPSRILSNSAAIPGISGDPQIVARGSGVYAVWAAPAVSSQIKEIAFAYSTNHGATFGAPVNLSSSPEPSELSVGFQSVPPGKVDEMVVGSGRVHVVWQEIDPTAGTFRVKYATGSLVASPFAVSGSGAASTSVTEDPSGRTEISQSDSSGNLFASVTLPEGASAASGTVSVAYSSVGGLASAVQVSGATVPYPPGKDMSFLVDSSTSAVCIDDSPSASVSKGACTTGANNVPYHLGCQATGTSSGALTFASGPSPRTYTCTLVSGPGSTTYAVVTGLAYTAVASIVLPADALRQLIAVVDGMRLPRGIANSLAAKLQAALRSIDAGKTSAALNQLHAFSAEVTAQAGKQMSHAQAQALTSRAERIGASI